MKFLAPLAAAMALAAGPLFAQDAPVPGVEFMAQWDLNGDGKVTLEEARERRGDIFTMFDQNEDDKYSADEIAMIDEHKELEREAGKGPGHQLPEGMQAGQGQGMGQGPGKGMGPGQGPGKGGMGPGKGMGQGMGQGPGQGRGLGPGGNAASIAGFDAPAAEGLMIFDTNGDGVISRQEFVAGTDLWFRMRDRNGDGAITEADFGPGN
ncbi:hypothetical protein [Thioclava pacifica]|uniref:EF-hand domain-containing protein n=1 Tax=Thioclava pacifica DSM 10166 TaxID=1353537 RepID=A0A074JUL1_9RHOB|nr:hypothetical protein [Thioclava pacifica]KEO53042.1 hypothetical protein TP2_08865 [Thioclava pacifica DSM 10166]